MVWDHFYDRYCDWSEATVKSAISSLEDIGSGEDVVEVCLNLFSEELSCQMIRKSMKLGVKFTCEDLINLEEELPRELFEQVVRYSGFASTDAFLNARDSERKVLNNNFKQRKKKSRFSEMSVGKIVTIGAALGIVKGLFGGKKKHSGRCDGDCDNCPAHYGYRYGRWYYGHGHNGGCEFGGNKGGGGKD